MDTRIPKDFIDIVSTRGRQDITLVTRKKLYDATLWREIARADAADAGKAEEPKSNASDHLKVKGPSSRSLPPKYSRWND